MTHTDLSSSVLSLTEADRIALARALVESVALDREAVRSIEDGVRRIDEVASGRVVGLTDEEYRAAAR
jgi:hypothetical protein